VLTTLLWVAATAHAGEALPLGLSAMDLALTAGGDVLQEVEPPPPDEATETAPDAVSDPEEPPQPDPDDPAPVDPATESFKTKWNRFVDASRGLLTWEFFKGHLTLRAGLRFQVDGTAASEDEQLRERYGDFGSSLDVRRFRAFAVGTIDRHLRYHVEYDFGADWGFKDAFVEGVDRGLTVWGYDIGQFRLGHFKEPFSLERQTSSNSFGFLEWSLPVGTFAPGRNIGFMLHDTARRDRVSWAAGFFSFGKSQEDNVSTSTLSITGRVTGLPIWQDEGRRLLHLGASFSTREPRSNEVQYTSRPEARFVPFMIDTGTITSSKTDLYGLEVAGVRGPLWLQSEWIQASVAAPDAGDPNFWGAYVQVGWFITGEVRHYQRGNGTFGRRCRVRRCRRGNCGSGSDGGLGGSRSRLFV